MPPGRKYPAACKTPTQPWKNAQLCTFTRGTSSLPSHPLRIRVYFLHHPHLPDSEWGKFVKAGVTTTQRVCAFWLKWNAMQHFLKSQLFPTCSIRTKHAKWAYNILTFVPCGIWGHKCPACHSSHLHSSCKSGPSLGEHTSLIHNSGWQGDRLPAVMELGSPARLHTGWTCCTHPPTSPRVR